MPYHQSRIAGWQSVVSVGSSVSSWQFRKSMHTLPWDTLSTPTVRSKDAQFYWSFVDNWLGSWLTTLGFDRRKRFWVKRWSPHRFISMWRLWTKPGFGWMGVSFVMQSRYTSSISAQGNAENASEPIAHAIHLSGCALAASPIMSFEPKMWILRFQSFSWSGGGIRTK